MTMADEMKALSAQAYGEHHTKKPDEYLDIYASYLDPIRERPLNLLELGVFTGASLLIWREVLPNAKIVGLDLRPRPELLDPDPPGIAFVQGDQGNPADLQRCLDQTADGAFDVIIDDASHAGAQSRASFDFLFTQGLKAKGLYFVEDFGAGYAPMFGGSDYAPPPPLNMDDKVFPSHATGMVGWLKQLVDEVTINAYFPAGLGARPLASCHFWPNVALIQKL
jgi:hypothetical protein